MINDPFHPEEAIARERYFHPTKTARSSLCRRCYRTPPGGRPIRKYHAQRVIENNTPPPVVETGPKGPALAHVVIDEPTIAKGVTTIGGVIKNISKQELTGVHILIELRRRKDGGVE